jgi:hypothetical protein
MSEGLTDRPGVGLEYSGTSPDVHLKWTRSGPRALSDLYSIGRKWRRGRDSHTEGQDRGLAPPFKPLWIRFLGAGLHAGGPSCGRSGVQIGPRGHPVAQGFEI